MQKVELPSITCPECKTELGHFSRVCPACGFPVAVARAKASKKLRRRLSRIVSIAVLCFGLCLIPISIGGFYKSKADHAEAVKESKEWARKNTATSYCMACEMDAWDREARTKDRIGTFRALIPVGVSLSVVGLIAWFVSRRLEKETDAASGRNKKRGE